jgi:hypothetical protein
LAPLRAGSEAVPLSKTDFSAASEAPLYLKPKKANGNSRSLRDDNKKATTTATATADLPALRKDDN